MKTQQSIHVKRRPYLILFSSFVMLGFPFKQAISAGGPPNATNGSSTFVAPADAPSSQTEAQPERPDDPSSATPLDFDSNSAEYPLGHGTPGFALSAGGAFQRLTNQWDSAAEVDAQYYFKRREIDTDGPEALSPWSLVFGAVLPHQIFGSGGPIAVQHIGNGIYSSTIKNFSSELLAIQYRWATHWPIRMTPEVSLGVSMAQIKNQTTAFESNVGFINVATTENNSLGPLVRIGLPLLANDWFSLRLDMGYVHYANNVNSSGVSFNTPLSGIGVYPSIQVSLGYLQPGVEKGVYLPPSALPLWVIAALQTGKRSPIIAPPEVLLNSHQAATQGGLSGNVMFQYKSRTADKVELMGDFNHWKPEPMYLDKSHVWVTVKDLKAGPYRYVYLVNGKREVRDPWNTSFDPSRRAHGVSSFVVPEVTPTF
jgi:hypothetical protein